MLSYTECQEAEQVAESVIPLFADWPQKPKIKYLMKVSEKSQFNAQIARATGRWQYLTQYDYVVEVWDGFWKKPDITLKQKEACIYHELYHISFKVDDETGVVSWGLQKHQIEEFLDVVQRYGAWNDTLKKFKEVLNSGV